MGEADIGFCKFTVDSVDGPLEDRELMDNWWQPRDSIKGSNTVTLTPCPLSFLSHFFLCPFEMPLATGCPLITAVGTLQLISFPELNQ